MQLAEKMKVKYQQVAKYELGQNQLCAFRLWQASHILGCKIKYFFDKDYINKMYGYHRTNIRRNAAMASELLDVDLLQAELDNELASLGGRIYLAKDSRQSSEMFKKTYSLYPKWRSIKSEIDPDNIFQSDLSKRLKI